MTTSGRQRHARTTVDGLLDTLDRLSIDDTLLLAQLWNEEDDEQRRRAWQRAKAAIVRSDLGRLLDQVRLEVGQWMQAMPADYQGISGLLGRESDDVSLRRHAAPAVLDAAAGLLAEPDLHPDDIDVLLRPWRTTLEAPQAASDEGFGEP